MNLSKYVIGFAISWLQSENIINKSQSALGYFLVSWGTKICATFDKLDEADIQEENGIRLSLTAFNLSRMMTDSNWAADDELYVTQVLCC